MIRRRPGAYAGLVVADLGRFFSPHERRSQTIALPGRPEHVALPDPRDAPPSAFEQPNPHELPTAAIRRRYFPGYRSPARWPARLLHDYQRLVHIPSWLTGVLAAAALAALIPAAIRRGPQPRARATFLLVGSGAASLVATAATAGYGPRYLLPATPLIICAAALGMTDLAREIGSGLRGVAGLRVGEATRGRLPARPPKVAGRV